MSRCLVDLRFLSYFDVEADRIPVTALNLFNVGAGKMIDCANYLNRTMRKVERYRIEAHQKKLPRQAGMMPFLSKIKSSKCLWNHLNSKTVLLNIFMW